MNYKIVFLDMDGTLYQTENDIIQQANLDAINELRKQGVLVCAATGRPLNQMKLILERIKFDYMVLINGGYVLDKEQRLLYENPLKSETTDEIVSWCNTNKSGLMFHFGDSSYIYNNFYPMYYFCRDHHVLDYLFFFVDSLLFLLSFCSSLFFLNLAKKPFSFQAFLIFREVL